MITNLPYKNGDAGVSDTIDLMNEYSLEYRNDPRVKKLVKSLSSSSEAKTLRNLHNYVVRKIRYQLDPDTAEVVASVKHTLFGNRPYGDCDDLSVALGTLLLSAGYKIAFVTIAMPGRTDFSHVYLAVYLPSQRAWMPCDPTKGITGFGWQLNPAGRRQMWRKIG